jgi:hypothetical protein
MRAKEFVSEAKTKQITKRQNQSSVGINVFNDGPEWTSDYSGYRLMIAAATTDGKTESDTPAETYIGRKKTAYPYTKEEQDKLKKAYKTVGAKYTDPNHGDMRSLELDDTNITSPVAKPKKNKYGV